MPFKRCSLYLCLPALAFFAAIPATGQEIEVATEIADVEVNTDDARVAVENEDVIDVDVATEKTARQQRSQMKRAERLNAQIASWVETDQRSIIDLAEFAKQKAQSSDVKDLAQTIIDEHTKLADQIADYRRDQRATHSTDSNRSVEATRRGIRRATFRAEATEEAEDVVDTRAERRQRFRERMKSGDGLEKIAERIETGIERVANRVEDVADTTRDVIDESGLEEIELPRRTVVNTPWVRIHENISKELSKNAQRDLSKYRGYEFDASFVGMLIASHLEQEATLKVLSRKASGDLSQTLKSAHETMEQHRKTAEKVMEQIAPGSPRDRS